MVSTDRLQLRTWFRAPAGRRAQRRRVPRVGVTGVAVLALLVGLGAGISQAGAPAAPPRQVVVQAGDTIWDLALAHLPRGADAATYVATVVATNAVDAARLRPGTVLDLPR